MANLHFNSKKDRKLKKGSEIIQNLYLGSKEIVDKYANYFDLIVNCTPDIKIPEDNKNNKIKYIRLPIRDEPFEANKLYQLLNETQVLQEINNYLAKGNKVLVHCFQGIQRSCAVVACYLIKYKKINVIQSIEFIKERRPIAFFGNVNFIETIEMVYKDTINKIIPL